MQDSAEQQVARPSSAGRGGPGNEDEKVYILFNSTDKRVVGVQRADGRELRIAGFITDVDREGNADDNPLLAGTEDDLQHATHIIDKTNDPHAVDTINRSLRIVGDASCTAIVSSGPATNKRGTRFLSGVAYAFAQHAHRQQGTNWPLEFEFNTCTSIVEVTPTNENYQLADKFFNDESRLRDIQQMAVAHEYAPGVCTNEATLQAIKSDVHTDLIENDPLLIPYYPAKEWVPSLGPGCHLRAMQSDWSLVPEDLQQRSPGVHYYLVLTYRLPENTAEQLFQVAKHDHDTWGKLASSEEVARAQQLARHASENILKTACKHMELQTRGEIALFETHMLKNDVKNEDAEPRTVYYAGTQDVTETPGAIVNIDDTGDIMWFLSPNATLEKVGGTGWRNTATLSAIATHAPTTKDAIQMAKGGGWAPINGIVNLQPVAMLVDVPK